MSIVVGGATYELPNDDGVASKVPSYNAALVALADQLDEVSGGVAWINVSFTNSWVNFGSTNQHVQYRKVGDMVQIRGMGKTGTVNMAAFTLPTGYRPPADVSFAVASNDVFGALTILANGQVLPAIGSNVYFCFSCSFSVTA